MSRNKLDIYIVLIVESLSALASCLQKFLQFPRFFAPGYSFWRRTRIHRDPGLKIFFRRAVHVQSFQSPCTCTARPALPSDFIPFDRANQELQNAFLDESLAQKEAKIWPFKLKVLTFLYFSHQLSHIQQSPPLIRGFWDERKKRKKPRNRGDRVTEGDA